MRPWVVAVVLMWSGSAAAALPLPQVQIAFSGGRVSVAAADAPIADVLAAWTRTGHCELIGAGYLGNRRVTITLTNTAETDALRAIVGAADWYTVTVRQTPATSDSMFERIVILPAAKTAASASDATAPEQRYAYSSDPEKEATVRAQLAQLPPARPSNRPPDVEPEAFYHYADTFEPSESVQLAGAVNRQPLYSSPGADPEVVYTYAPTTPLADPVVTSAITPEPQAVDPEQRFTYAATTPLPADASRPTAIDGGIPDLLVLDGFSGLQRLPGRVIRYVVNR